MRLPGVTVSPEGAALSGSWVRACLRAAGWAPATVLRVGAGKGVRARGVDVCFLHQLCLENGTVFAEKWQSKREDNF